MRGTARRCRRPRFIASDDAAMAGAFKTPSLRNVVPRPPYMHAGRFATLEAVIAHYVRAPAAAAGHTGLAHGAEGHTARQPMRHHEQEIRDLAAFLDALSAPLVERAVK